MSEKRSTNALAQETSPYLLQHAHNPVEWYPWCEEALRRAREENKPTLLSIGYSACHWCHVMERESFEDEAIARLMNEHFVNIKVDREERPDLDAIYMNAVQLMTGRGGWPLTVFLTPEQVPFYGGTYFPPEDRHGLPGFARVLRSVSDAYREHGERIRRDAAKIAHEIGAATRIAGLRTELDSGLLDAAASGLAAHFDPRHGGFDGPPKFPPSMALDFLMRSYVRTANPHLLEIVEVTLQQMAAGGIRDHLGGGFHRYAVDAGWLVPHFEKMLYDNALLSRVYLEAFLLTGNGLYRRIAEETLDFVLREMTAPEGGFYSSQDADSEGEEGAFYTWRRAEVMALLGDDEGELFCRYFDVSAAGNFEGRNVLHTPRPAALVARWIGVAEERLDEAVARGRRILFEARLRRARPARDEKIVASWNGLMLKSFAQAGCALDRSDYLHAAVRNAEFLTTGLMSAGRLLRTFAAGKAKHPACLEDHAALADALLSLYEATFDLRWLHLAEELAATMLTRFRDPEGGGFYFTADDHEKLIQRPRDIFDNATPSGNSLALHVLLRLWHLTAEERWLEPASEIFEKLAGTAARHPAAFCHLLGALDFHLSGGLQITVAGDAQDSRTRELLRAVYGRYLPNRVIACGTAGEPRLLEGRPQIGDRPTAYVCTGRVCAAPATTAAELAARLG